MVGAGAPAGGVSGPWAKTAARAATERMARSESLVFMAVQADVTGVCRIVVVYGWSGFTATTRRNRRRSPAGSEMVFVVMEPGSAAKVPSPPTSAHAPGPVDKSEVLPWMR